MCRTASQVGTKQEVAARLRGSRAHSFVELQSRRCSRRRHWRARSEHRMWLVEARNAARFAWPSLLSGRVDAASVWLSLCALTSLSLPWRRPANSSPERSCRAGQLSGFRPSQSVGNARNPSNPSSRSSRSSRSRARAEPRLNRRRQPVDKRARFRRDANSVQIFARNLLPASTRRRRE